MKDPLPAPSATGVRIAGDRYQWLVAWGACVDALLDASAGVDNPIVNVGVEVDGAGNLDDVVVYRRRPPHGYKQVKYTVDSRTPVNTAYLTEPSPSGGPSILRKIAASWQSLARPGSPSSWRSSPIASPTTPIRWSLAATPELASVAEAAVAVRAPHAARRERAGRWQPNSPNPSCSNFSRC